MPVNTASAAVHITPVVLKTFLKHTKRKGVKAKDGDKTVCAVDDIYYDEAFHIVKAFIELGTHNTVESLQAFTNTHVPAPYWVAVVPIKIPLSSCNRAADTLIDWFGTEELRRIVGGERWWQVRGLDWIDAEWITEKEFLKDTPVLDDNVKKTEDEKTIRQMECLDRVMLYVHGGAFFWGSINTHRYQVIRYAKKFRGRAFSVNYRKAPQYPWPCPLQDVLAAYFYLTNPPPGAVHKAVQPSKLVLAGDSAGAGLCISALTVLRDLGLSLPAGAVLISPWVDLTHSFPSVTTNTATDIIPPHGFIHKPSTLWPVHPKSEGGYTRVLPTRTKPPPQPGHADKLKPSAQEAEGRIIERLRQGKKRGNEGSLPHASELDDDPTRIPTQTEMQQAQDDVDVLARHGDHSAWMTEAHPSDAESRDSAAKYSNDVALEFWEPKPPKVLMEDPNATPWELRAQIQLYATTEQLSHPLVSPVLQSSLGNLCPLYILAGDGECLRDEIIYLAHKAANPKDYPVRQGILREGHRQQENVAKFQTPTKVHLQVFDDLCHVLTVFTFTEPGKFAYRSIADFVKGVIDSPGENLYNHRPPEADKSDSEDNKQDDIRVQSSNVSKVEHNVKTGPAASGSRPELHVSGVGDKYAEPIIFIRERVNPLGKVRPMEAPDQLLALRLPPSDIGLIKEGPVRRWLAGQEAWDKRFQNRASVVLRKRRRYETKWEKLLQHAKQEGLFGEAPLRSTASVVSVGGAIEPQRRWGPLDLENENPPPSAIAGRKDTREAVALLKKVLYHSAPQTHQQVPKLKTTDVIRAALNPNDSALKAPTQSVSEQQIRMRFTSVHGLKMWQSIVEWFMRKSSEKVAQGGQQAVSTMRSAVDKVTPTASPPSD